MHFAKIAAALGLALTVSAAEWESICVKGKIATLFSNNGANQNNPCLTVSLESVTDKWGGGRSNCDNGSYEAYWNVARDGQTWLCYGNPSNCAHIKATNDPRLATEKGYERCYSVQIRG
jgi:hypothetical protein